MAGATPIADDSAQRSTAETEAANAAGMRDYARRYGELRRRHEAGLRAYGERAAVLIGPDARQRHGKLRQYFMRDEHPELGPITSLTEAAELQFCGEEHHSLMLAWLLDPVRSGDVAVCFWRGLLAELRDIRQNDAEATALHRRIIDNWHSGLLDRLEVDPKRHRIEKYRFDVFARVHERTAFEFGLLIENKVNRQTSEQPDQLLRYYQRVVAFGQQAEERTLFVFLTEGARLPESAGVCGPRWLVLGWKTVADLLLRLAHDPGLHVAQRVLLLQYRSAIQRAVLGQDSEYELRRRFWRIEQELKRLGPAASRWERLHADIVDTARRMHCHILEADR